MPFPFVARSLYDDLQRRYDVLFERYDRLKLAGATVPPEPKPGRVIQSGPTPEEAAARRMHDQLIDELASDIEKMPGIPPEVAKAEARRIREQALGASFNDPPV